jgi:ABC-type bacteriocin/lantibiotic exporter with double-glycine peptidase domain
MISDFKKINNIIDKREKYKLSVLAILKFFSGLLDMLAVATIAPFLTLLINPNYFENNKYFIKFESFFLKANQEFILLFGIFSISIIIFNQLFKIIIIWFENYVTKNVEYNLVTNLFNFYLKQPYYFYLKNSKSSLLEKVAKQGNIAVSGVITPFFAIVEHLFTATFLMMLVLVVNLKLSVIVFLLIIFFYILFIFSLSRKIKKYGKYSPEFSKKAFKIVADAFKSIKEIKVNKNSNFFLNLFKSNAKKYVNNSIKYHFILNVPRPLLEIFAYSVGYSVIIFLILKSENSIEEIIFNITLFALAFQKILPAMQNIYRQYTEYKYAKFSFNIIYNDLIESHKFIDKNLISENKSLRYDQKITLKNIYFKYENNEKFTFFLSNLELKKGYIIGLTGKSGSGKSTFIDLLLGLVYPLKGEIITDNKNTKTKIGYLPQDIFISDDTIENNITNNFQNSKYTNSQIRSAAQNAQILSHIENNLPKKFKSNLGEDGINFSGGQRQRIGIARIILQNPDLMILDESTNALDLNTEKKILEHIQKIKKDKIILLISHRTSVLKFCDKIIYLDNGQLKDEGTLDNLIEKNSSFKEMISG